LRGGFHPIGVPKFIYPLFSTGELVRSEFYLETISRSPMFEFGFEDQPVTDVELDVWIPESKKMYPHPMVSYGT
jgi:hypothetical protein